MAGDAHRPASEPESDCLSGVEFRAAFRKSPMSRRWVEPVRATVVGLVTPHFLRVIDLAKEAEAGVNVDWHLKDAVAKEARVVMVGRP